MSAWASPQSLAIADRSLLEKRAAEIDKKFAGFAVLPKPKHWGGYKIQPYLIEFWQGRQNRLHDRILYTIDGRKWKINRLAP